MVPTSGVPSGRDLAVDGTDGGVAPSAGMDWPSVWATVAARVAAHEKAGRGHLLTEDAVRFETVKVLEEVGVAPTRLAVEVLAPPPVGGRLDLVVDGLAGAVVELKFPRDSRTGISPDTMTFGELLRDFLRVAAAPARDRWVVQLLNHRLARYVDAASGRNGLHWSGVPGEAIRLPAAALATLPRTATQAIGAAVVTGTVTAECVAALQEGEQLTLYAYRVDGMAGAGATAGDRPPLTASEPGVAEGPPAEVVAATRDGARRDILDAARAVLSRSGREAFTMPEVIAEMHRRGTGYAERTIRTMISAHLCAEAAGDGVAGYADLTRVGRGLYRLTEPQRS